MPNLEYIKTWDNTILAGPITWNQRKKWMKENISKLMHLNYVILLRKWIHHKLYLDVYKEKHKASLLTSKQ